jgi:DNA transposition AAA+ family ATPase
MRAISRLLDSGMTRKQIALSAGVSEQAIGMCLNDKRWPRRSLFSALVELAASRGIELSARDFLFERK